MVAIEILGLSGAALVHFAAIYSRAVLAEAAAEPLSPHIRQAGFFSGDSPSRTDLHALASLHEICPELRTGGRGIGAVRAYFRLLSAIGEAFPILADWTAREMSTCARYAAVRTDQRLQRTVSHLSQITSG